MGEAEDRLIFDQQLLTALMTSERNVIMFSSSVSTSLSPSLHFLGVSLSVCGLLSHTQSFMYNNKQSQQAKKQKPSEFCLSLD